jgi:predicted ribosome quality control (RQC) complex YloA/Tae2 family protein
MMKTEITAFDLAFLVRELQPLVNERLDKIYILEDRGILLTFGTKQLLQASPGRCWTPLTKPETPAQIHPFAAQLRKLIGNSKITAIEQVCSERILAMRVIRSEKCFTLYLELFGRGNAVLCDANNLVLAALATNQRAQQGKPYALPQSTDTFHLDERVFAENFLKSTDNVSKTLAVQFGLGKTLAEELCVRCGIPATAPVTEEHAHELFHALRKLLEQHLSAQLIWENSILVDATPVQFDCYANKKRENAQHFGQALARIFALPAAAIKEQKLSPLTLQLHKIDTMIALQQKNLDALEAKAAEERKKGEYFYEHYQEIKQLLTDIIEARKTFSWKEIKCKFTQIKDINEATGDVVVEW